MVIASMHRTNQHGKEADTHLEAVEGPLGAEGAEELDELLGVDGVGVDDDALDIGEVGVVLQRAHVQASLLAQLRNARAVVVRQHPVRQNRVRHLRRLDQVDLQQLQH